MFTKHTFQDWQKKTINGKISMLSLVVSDYKASDEFKYAIDANEYKAGRNPEVLRKILIKQSALQTETGDLTVISEDVIGNRISSNFFGRFVTQQNQYLLGYGVELDDDAKKAKLGAAFDKALQRCGEMALTQGVSYGFWNNGVLQPIEAAVDVRSGFAPLLDERTSELRAGIQFWQIDSERPIYYRLYEVEGWTEYMQDVGDVVRETTPQTKYKQIVRIDSLGKQVMDGENYPSLPVVPFYANSDAESELTANIKTKIDLYDTIMSDYADNFERANDVYWVLNHFSGNATEIKTTLDMLNKLKVAISQSDNGGATAEPHTIEVPYQARTSALNLLKKELYSDYMALDMDDIQGGSLTNVAINAATKNMDLKADMYEYQALEFVQQILALAGIKSDNIEFRRNRIENEVEKINSDYILAQTVQLMKPDIGQKQALKYYPLIEHDKATIDAILLDTQAETVGGQPSIDDLQDEIDSDPQQVQKVVDIVEQFASGATERQAALDAIMREINATEEEANALLDNAGKA